MIANEETQALLAQSKRHNNNEEESNPLTRKMLTHSATHVVILSSAIAFASRVVVLLYSIYATTIFQVSKVSIGNFFGLYGVLACVSALTFRTLHPEDNFDKPLILSVILPAIGFTMAISSNNYTVFTIGLLFSCIGLTIPVTSTSYMNRLSKMSALLPAEHGGFMRFSPLLAFGFTCANVLSPAVALLYSVHPNIPFVIGLGICVIFGNYSIFYMIGTYKTVEDMGGPLIIMNQLEGGGLNEDGNGSIRFTIGTSIVLLGVARFFSSAGNMSVHAFYILYMSENFGVAPWYSICQMIVGAVSGCLATIMLKKWRNTINPDMGVLFGTVLSFAGAFGMYMETSHSGSFFIPATWAWYICMMVGHVIQTAYLMALVVLISRSEFMNRVSSLMSTLAILPIGLGPYLFTRSGFNLFLFQSILQMLSLTFCVLFFFSNAIALVRAKLGSDSN